MLDDLKQYINNRVNLVKLEIIDVASNLISVSLYSVILGIIILLMMILGNFAAAYYIGTWLDDNSTGFFIVFGFYLLLLLILVVFKKFFKRKLADITIRVAMEAMDNSEEEEDEE